MPQVIDRKQLQTLREEAHAQLVEVLPARQYHDVHLPGALNLPLQELDAESAAILQRDRPVIVYCYDYQ
jgi:rhodanese-related sulfurtransferase